MRVAAVMTRRWQWLRRRWRRQRWRGGSDGAAAAAAQAAMVVSMVPLRYMLPSTHCPHTCCPRSHWLTLLFRSHSLIAVPCPSSHYATLLPKAPLALHSLILTSPMPVSHMRLSFSARIALVKTATLALPSLTMRTDAEMDTGIDTEMALSKAEIDAVRSTLRSTLRRC